MSDEKLYFSKPSNMRIYHIFKGKGGTSLCNKVLLLFADKDAFDEVKGNETYKKGQDCKSCFRRAELKTE